MIEDQQSTIVMIEPVVHTTQIRVRYAHTDKMGIVYNGNYLMFFEIGRTELLRAAGLPYAQLELDGFLLPVLEAHVVYHKPARYDEMLDVITTYNPESSPVLTMKYDIRRGDDLIVSGFTKHAFVDAASFRPVRPPRSFLETMHRL